MDTKNIFSSLYPWARRQGENFTTDAFVYLLKDLLDREPQITRSVLSQLCFGVENDSSLADLKPSDIETQRRDEDSVPDIWIRTSGSLVLIEVKKGADLAPGQLRDYRKLLSRRCSAGHLILLTAFQATFDPDEKPDLDWRWSDVERWLVAHVATDLIAKFLIDQFLQFLRAEVMTIDRVEWQYIEGTRSLFRLIVMLE